MRILSIAGPSNNSGKTLLACRILERYGARAQALKVSTIYADGNCPRNAQSKACACTQLHRDDYRVISEPAVLGQPDTDTAEIIQTGAQPVLWGLARPGAHAQLWEHLRSGFLAPDRPLLTEGGKIAQLLGGRRLVVVVNPYTRRRWKDDTPELLEAADLVLVNPYDKGFQGHSEPAVALLDQLGQRGLLFDVSRAAEEWPEQLTELVTDVMGTPSN